MNKFLTLAYLILLPQLAWAEFEPNDHPAEANRLEAGTTITGQILSRRDVDRFVVNAAAGTEIVLSLGLTRSGGDEGEGGSLGLWRVSVLRPDDGLQIAGFESNLKSGESLRIGAGTEGDYEIVVEQGFFHSTDEYVLSVQAVSQSLEGIWSTDAGFYVSIHEKGDNLIAVILSETGEEGWEAMSGSASGGGATLTTIVGGAEDRRLDITPVTHASFVAILSVCEPPEPAGEGEEAPDTCADFTEQATFQATRVF